MDKRVTKKQLVGGALSPNAGISSDYAKPVVKMITAMYQDVRKELAKLYATTNFEAAMDASVSSQARILINFLLKKWQKKFDEIAKTSTDRMVERTLKNSATTLTMSLKDASKDFAINTSFYNEQINEIIKASTQEAANLIKVIPQQFLNDVQGQVMRSITTGNGMQDLVPFLKKKYSGDIKKARLVALDQTRKTYQSINTSRLKTLGVKKFIWIHSGGGSHPRPLHVKMSGNEYSFDDPPYIGDMYGSEIRGLPGDLPYCRCIYKPVILDLE